MVVYNLHDASRHEKQFNHVGWRHEDYNHIYDDHSTLVYSVYRLLFGVFLVVLFFAFHGGVGGEN